MCNRLNFCRRNRACGWRRAFQSNVPSIFAVAITPWCQHDLLLVVLIKGWVLLIVIGGCSCQAVKPIPCPEERAGIHEIAPSDGYCAEKNAMSRRISPRHDCKAIESSSSYPGIGNSHCTDDQYFSCPVHRYLLLDDLKWGSKAKWQSLMQCDAQFEYPCLCILDHKAINPVKGHQYARLEKSNVAISPWNLERCRRTGLTQLTKHANKCVNACDTKLREDATKRLIIFTYYSSIWKRTCAYSKKLWIVCWTRCLVDIMNTTNLAIGKRKYALN